MITTTCNQYTARAWFKSRTLINLGAVFIGFIVLVFILQNCIHPLIADVIAVGLAYAVFFYVLGKRAIAIECPHCKGYIETNTPWKCGNPKCGKDNERLDEFPFVNCCQHCGVEPKAYKCHHCDKIIFLSKDKLATLCATLIKSEKKSASPPPRKSLVVDKIDQENQAIRETEYKLRKAKLDLELKTVEKDLNPPKEKAEEEKLEESVKIFQDRNMSGIKIVARLKAENAAKFKPGSEELKRADMLVDQWASNHLDQM